MDILRRELNEIYDRQHLSLEQLDHAVVSQAVERVKSAAACTGACYVVTDIAANCSYFVPGKLSGMLGLTESETRMEKIDSSDEDFLYSRILPLDLAELRMLEYEFFKIADATPPAHKLDYKAYGHIAMRGACGVIGINKSTQVLALSPASKIWLVLCTYEFAPQGKDTPGISPAIVNLATGDRDIFLDFEDRRANLLSPREKQVLALVADGKLSKEIADALNISVYTVNRHRQNILEKLSVDNSMEAVIAARAMGLMQ